MWSGTEGALDVSEQQVPRQKSQLQCEGSGSPFGHFTLSLSSIIGESGESLPAMKWNRESIPAYGSA